MKQKIISLIAGTLILFVWNALSWMVLPFHSNTLNLIPAIAINTELLKEHLTKDGVYHYPGFPKDNTPQALKEMENRIETGPRITLMVFKSGKTELFSTVSFLGSIAINFITVLLLYSLIHLSRVQTTKTILLMMLFVALLIGFASDLAQMNWYLFPLDYTVLNMADHLIPFLLVGILFSKYSFRMKTA